MMLDFFSGSGYYESSMTGEKRILTSAEKDTIINEKLAGTRFRGDEQIAIPINNVPDNARHDEALEKLGVLNEDRFITTIRGFGHVCIDFFEQDAVDSNVIELTMDAWLIDRA